MTNAITKTLSDHESVIERGLQSFVEVGNALSLIRDGKMYREFHKTFADYCDDRWGWTQQYATQICRSAETVKVIGKSETMVSLPATERQARPLTKLPADEQAEAWEEVVAESEKSGEKITAAILGARNSLRELERMGCFPRAWEAEGEPKNEFD